MKLVYSFRFILIAATISLIFTHVFADDPLYLNVTVNNACPSSLLKPEEIEELNIKLFDAIEKGEYDTVEKTLQAGAQANAIKIAATYKRPLHAAVFVGRLDIVKLLLDFGAIIGFETEGHTPFAYLAYQEHLHSLDRRSIVELFITNPPQLKQKYIDDAFHHAVMARNVIVAEAILKYAEISDHIADKLNYYPSLMDTFIDVATGMTFSGAKQLKEKHHYAWMSRQLAQRAANQPTTESEQNTAD